MSCQRSSCLTAKNFSITTGKPWRNPIILGAIIAGIAAISVAVIQRTAPKPKLSEPTKIEQQTHGSGSPAVGQTGGNVTIQQQGLNPTFVSPGATFHRMKWSRVSPLIESLLR